MVKRKRNRSGKKLRWRKRKRFEVQSCRVCGFCEETHRKSKYSRPVKVVTQRTPEVRKSCNRIHAHLCNYSNESSAFVYKSKTVFETTWLVMSRLFIQVQIFFNSFLITFIISGNRKELLWPSRCKWNLSPVNGNLNLPTVASMLHFTFVLCFFLVLFFVIVWSYLNKSQSRHLTNYENEWWTWCAKLQLTAQLDVVICKLCV